MSRLSQEETLNIMIGQMARQFHLEITGEQLGLFELPCTEALERTMLAVGQMEKVVTDLKGWQDEQA